MRRVPRRQGQLGIEGPRRMAPFDGHGQVRHQLRSLVEATGLEKLGKNMGKCDDHGNIPWEK